MDSKVLQRLGHCMSLNSMLGALVVLLCIDRNSVAHGERFEAIFFLFAPIGDDARQGPASSGVVVGHFI